MTVMRRYRIEWNGLSGLPGLSTFYTDADEDAGADLVAFYSAIKDRFPVGTSWSIPNSGDTIEDSTGALVGAWSGTGGGTVSSSASVQSYAAGTGAYIRWNTVLVVAGRRVKGRTFLCPLIGSQYEDNGTLSSGFITAANTGAAEIVTNGSFRVWHRPSPGGSGGSSSYITSAQVPDRVTSLRSRRV